MVSTSATLITFAASAFTALYQAGYFVRDTEPGPTCWASDRACLVFEDEVSGPQQAWLARAVLQSEHILLLAGAILLLALVGLFASVRCFLWCSCSRRQRPLKAIRVLPRDGGYRAGGPVFVSR